MIKNANSKTGGFDHEGGFRKPGEMVRYPGKDIPHLNSIFLVQIDLN